MNEEEYKVSVYSSRMPFPLTAFVHCYIVVSHNTTVDRFEVFHPKTIQKHPSKYCGRIYKNALPAKKGMKMYPSWKLEGMGRFLGKEYSTITGGNDSLAEEIYDFVFNDGLVSYPFTDTYSMIKGPNSNTFVQWFVGQFPKSELTLPWNAWGKNYKYD